MKSSNVLSLVIGLLVGAITVYFVTRPGETTKPGIAENRVDGTQQAEDTLKSPAIIATLESKRKNKAILWESLPPEVGYAMIRDYSNESGGLWHPLRTIDRNGDNQILRGFWIDKVMLETIFKQGPQYNGVRIFFGKRKGAQRREYSLVFIGTTPNPADPGNPNNSGTYYDYVDPCPTNCGGNEPPGGPAPIKQ